jgi:hypothetical protein
MYFGLMLSDYIFSTDKWYWQTLTYILSLIIAILVLLATSALPVYLIADYRDMRMERRLTVWSNLKLIVSIILIIANIVFSIYSVYYAIKYIIVFHKTRDIVLGSLGSIIVIGLTVFGIIGRK